MFFIKKNTIIAFLISTGLFASMSSVLAQSEFFSYATSLSDNKIINTNTEVGYRLSAMITRGELAKIAANIGEYTPLECTNKYTDVDNSLGDLCGYILALREAGVISANERYRPRDAVSRAEMVKILLGAAGEKWSTVVGPFSDISGYGDLASYIVRANEIGCARASVLFRPAAPSTRGETFKIASCIIDYKLKQTITVSWE